jgi:uncharacterized FlgJ-related protein
MDGSIWDRLKDDLKEAVIKELKEYPSFEKLKTELQETYFISEVRYFAYRDLRDISILKLNKKYKEVTHLVDFFKED